jgi:hypothetical protein
MIFVMLVSFCLVAAVALATAGLLVVTIFKGNGFVLMATILTLSHLYPILRRRAWNVKVQVEESTATPQLHRSKGYTFVGRAPGFDARGIYQVFVHGPLYITASCYTLFAFVFVMVGRHQSRRVLNGQKKLAIRDEDVARVCVQTSLILLCHFDGSLGTLRLKMPGNAPSLGMTGRNLDTRTLEILLKIDDWSISETTTVMGPVEDEGDVSRNELLIAALTYILAHWFHSLIHVAAERSALEIQGKRITQLEPSCHFVSSLHEGLIHGLLSPLNFVTPFTGAHHDSAEMVETLNESPYARHDIDPRKDFLEYYAFAISARRIVFQLVARFKLDADPENLFLNCVWHGVDHFGYTQAVKNLPLWSIDGSGSWLSRWRAFTFVNIWATNEYINPFDSDLLCDHHVADGPFYAHLYAELVQVNPVLANAVRVTCGF